MKRNVIILAVCQALLMSGNSLVITATALAGLNLAPDPLWATLPFALQFAGMIATTYPASMMMQRLGRKPGFTLGAVCGIAGAALSTWSLVTSQFWFFCLGAALLGAFNAFAQYYRFAAAEVAAENYRNRAISYVMAGGVIAAFIGPNLARATRDLVGTAEFAGCYAAVIGLYLISLLLVQVLRIKNPATAASRGQQTAVTWTQILRTPVFLTAVISGAVGYGVMNLLMTSTPLAMNANGFHFDHAASVIQWHVFAMFAPAFITGHLITRFGAHRIMIMGTFTLLVCCGVNMTGTGYWHFLTALVLLGLGWNFCFIGATSLLTRDTAARGKVQGLNDLLVFTTVGVSAICSGLLHHTFGWNVINLIVLPLILTAMFTLIRDLRRISAPAA